MGALTVSDMPHAVLTAGEIFPDGTAIDRLRDNLLILWRDGKQVIAPLVEYQGTPYTAAAIDPSLEEMLKLPSGAEDFGTVEDLLGDLQAAVRPYLDLQDDARLLLVSIILCTWVIEALRQSPTLNPWGPAGSEHTLVQLLSCFCRRPLQLVDVSLRALSQLPRGLSPTLVLRSARPRSLAPLLAAAADPDAALLQNGQIMHPRFAMVVCTRAPLELPAFGFSLIGGSSSRCIGKEDAEALRQRFQPRLLQYRLRQHLSVAKSQFDAPGFAPESRMLAMTLGAAVEGAPHTQARILEILANIGEQRKVDNSQTLAAVVLEALMVACSEGRSAIYVREVAELVNGILLGRGEDISLTPKAIGGILRNDLGLYGTRRGAGWELVLNRQTRERIRRLATALNVLSGLEPSSVATDIHDVHHVQPEVTDGSRGAV